MTGPQENALGHAASAYLRSARDQPVAWMEWGEAAFARAQQANKPVLLDIGAVWCHWCHVMDRESYEDPETAALINEHFVAVKVDRDERPDVDTRYQAAVASISGQGGWPLTAFLTPEGMPFFGGTYFPPEERYGRPSFRRVLLTMAEAFRVRREEVEESASSVFAAIQDSESFSGHAGSVGEAGSRDLLRKLIGSALRQFDERNGGFGSQPKFPYPGVLDLLIDAAGRGDAEAGQAAHIVRVTLEKMASGGMYDQLGGGFHRYSVDERWHVPHFEKMAYDNSELLKTYAHAWQSFREPRFREVAVDIVRWMDEVLSDRERGGFYASQDADVSPDDDGGYFTWTAAEMREVLSPEQFAAAELYFGVRTVGDMPHDPARNVLRRRSDLPRLAESLGVSVSEAETRLALARGKLQAVRWSRPMPFVDWTVYTGWNAMCISAYLTYVRAVGEHSVEQNPLEFALRSLDRVLAEAWEPARGRLAHVVAYGEAAAEGERGQEVPGGSGVPGVLEDYAFLATAALDAWEATGEHRYWEGAQAVADAMLLRFWDDAEAGFFDTERLSGEQRPLGALAARRKPLQDAPSPAGNAVAAAVLLRLAELTGAELYATRARETLQAFAGVVEHFGLHAASYGLALRRLVEAPYQVCIVGEDALADKLAAAAEQGFAVGKSVIRLRRDTLRVLPPALAETLPHLPVGTGSVAVVCRGHSCLPPTRSVEELKRLLSMPPRLTPSQL